MRKHNKVLILCAILIFGIFTSVCASDYEADVVVSLTIDNPIMCVNGEEAEIDAGRGTKPIVTKGRTLVPIRAIIEAFNGTVGWDENTQTATLTVKDDTVKLVINSKTAYLNGESKTLDVAPVIINERTMLPIRFVAESFNLGVAWEQESETVFIVRNGLDQKEYNELIKVLPVYNGQAYAKINNNIPFFEDYEIINGSFEYYSDLDPLGRCNVAFASVSTDIMPTGERESISSVTPTGWHNKAYDIVDGGYLYNRCHLIGYQLTGENANERNLITGTRYLNINGMLPFENMIDDYIEQTGNQVMYRVTPVFKDNNLVADGVLMEAYSVEDKGEGISFCVYCYNVQPDITIDYLTGYSSLSGEEQIKENDNETVYRTPTGKKYHFDTSCGGKNSFETTLEKAVSDGLTPCSKCAK